MCVLHRKWKTTAELCEHRYGGAPRERASRLSVIGTTDLHFLQKGFCCTALRNHSLKREEEFGDSIELPFQKHSCAMNLNFGNQKVECMTNRK